MMDALATLVPCSDSMTRIRTPESQASRNTNIVSCTTVFNIDREVTLMSAASRLWTRGAKSLQGPTVQVLRLDTNQRPTRPAHIILSYWSHRPATQSVTCLAFSGSIQGQSF